MSVAIEERFFKRLMPRDTGCIEWTGARSSTGYGLIATRTGESPMATHRLAWQLAHGEIADGLSVLHKCDNRLCCNAAHLFLGTHRDNARDALDKGRLHGLFEAGRRTWNLGARKHAVYAGYGRSCIEISCQRCGKRAWKRRDKAAKFCSRSCANAR